MPTYEFKKDGDTAVTPIDAPDMATALKLFKSGAAATPLASAEGTVPKPAASELALPEEPAGVLSRIGSGIADPAYGLKQLYEHTAGTPESAAAQDAATAEREERLKRTGAGEGDLARSAGRMVPAVVAGALTGGSALAAGLGGAAAEMLNPITPSKESGDYWEKKINQGLIGGATGFAGGAAAKVIGSVIAPALSPEARQLVDAGIQLTPGRLMPGQIAGAITRRAEDAFKSFPILGTFIRGAEGRSLESYNKATVNQALEPIGTRVPNNINAGHDAVSYATNALDQRYDSILRSNPLLRMPPTIWPHLESEIQNTAFLARALPPNEQGLQFQQILQQHVLRNLDPLAQGQPLPGQVVHAIESDLRHFVRTYRGSPNPNDREMARYLDDVRSSIRDALATTNPQEAQALRNTDYAYAMLVRVQDAAARRPTGQGVFTPADMLAVIKKNDPSVRKNSFAQGNALMQDFAEVAQRLLPSKLADSGTPERVLWDVGGGAGLFGTGHPGVLAGLGAASLPYTRPGMALTDMVVRPGPARTVVGNAARSNAGRIGTVMEPQAAGMLTDESGERPNLPQRMLPLGTPGQNGDLPHRAEGGRVSGPTVVGEGGKEIFVPDQPGTIIPNDETEKILARSAIEPSVYDRFVNALHGVNAAIDPVNLLGDPVPRTGSVGGDMLAGLPLATFGMKPSVRLTPTTNTTRLQLDGRFARQPVNPIASKGFRNWPAVGGAQAGAAALSGGEEAPAGGKGASGVEAAPSTPGENFNERWGSMAPPAAAPQASQPLFMQSGEMNVPLSELTVPLPRPKPAQGKSAPRPKPKAAAAPPNILEQLANALRGIDLSQLVQPVRQGRNTATNGHYEDGGQPPVGEPATVGEAGPELFVPDAATLTQPVPPAHANFASLMDPFERAAHRQREAVQPGRPMPGPPPVNSPEDAALALVGLAAPGPLKLVGAAPKLATGLLAAYYGLSGTDEAGGGEAPKTPQETKQLQLKLRDTLDAEGKPLYAGTIDGVYGEATRNAVSRFENMEAAKTARKEELDRETQNKKTDTESKKADAELKAADAKIEETKLEAKKLDEKAKGSARLKEVEGQVSPWQRLLRDYATPAGLTAGVLGGAGARATVAKIYNNLSANRATNAAEIMAKEAPDVANRVGRVNDFWRKGGAKEVPFTDTPATAPGFAANLKATDASALYQPSTTKNLLTDAGLAGGFGAESVMAQQWLEAPARERLAAATTAAAADPSEVNIQELQAAKDSLAIAEFWKTFGRVGGVTSVGASKFTPRKPQVPSLQAAEAEKMNLEDLLRKAQKNADTLAARKAKTAAKTAPQARSLAEPVGIPPAMTGPAAYIARQTNGQ